MRLRNAKRGLRKRSRPEDAPFIEEGHIAWTEELLGDVWDAVFDDMATAPDPAPAEGK